MEVNHVSRLLADMLQVSQLPLCPEKVRVNSIAMFV